MAKNKPQFAGGGFNPDAGKPGDIPVTGGTYNPVTQVFTPTTTQEPTGVVPSTPQTPQTQTEDPQITAAKIAAAQRQAEIDAENQRRKDMTSGVVKAAFDMYGLSALFPLIQEYAQRGLTEEEIYMNLRNTEAYKARFPAMAELSNTGRAITEAAYVDYERKAAQMEQMYGLPKGMVMGSVTDLLIGDVSAVELQERILLASADSMTAPEDLKQTLSQYYGVDGEEALRGYYLEPDIALPILQKQSASARIGVQATRAGVNGVARSLAEELQGIGITEDQARTGFGRVADQSGLSAGKGDTASTDVLIDANLKNSAQAREATTRVAQGRVGRFAGGGQFASDKSGMAGLGTA